MYRERLGPCNHCGISRTRLWMAGPPEKPVLCHTCGVRWVDWGTLDANIPSNAKNNNKSGQSSGLPPVQGPVPITVEDYQLPDFGTDIFYGHHAAGLDEDTIASLGMLSPLLFSGIFAAMLNPEATVVPAFGSSASSSGNIPRRRRSVLPQRTLSPLERLHSQLHEFMQQPPPPIVTNNNNNNNNNNDNNNDQAAVPDVDYDDDLIYAKNPFLPENEIGLGCIRLPPSPTTPPKPEKPKKENGLEVCFLLDPPSHLPHPTGKFPETNDDDVFDPDWILFVSSISDPRGKGKAVAIDTSENEVMVMKSPAATSSDPKGKGKGKGKAIVDDDISVVDDKELVSLEVMLLKSPTEKAAPATEDYDGSGLVDVPIGVSSDQVGLEIRNFPNVNERGEMQDKKFSSHHMTTRSRSVSKLERSKFLEEIYTYGSSRKAKVTQSRGRPRGRPRKHTSQGSGSRSGKPIEDLRKEIKVETLANDVVDKLVLNVHEATLERDNPPAPIN